MFGFSPNEFSDLSEKGAVLERAHLTASAAIGQFLCDRYEEFGYDNPKLHAAAVWADMVEHDHSTSSSNLDQYSVRNRSKVEESWRYLISNDVDFAHAAAIAVHLEWGHRLAISDDAGAERVFSGRAFNLLCQLYPELMRSPQILDPDIALGFFDEWNKKWNRRIK